MRMQDKQTHRIMDSTQSLNAMAYNGGAYVTWPEPNKGEGHVAEARAVARRSPRRPSRAPMHTTRCYAPLRFTLRCIFIFRNVYTMNQLAK
jgi:hypothetical protein